MGNYIMIEVKKILILFVQCSKDVKYEHFFIERSPEIIVL